MKSSVTKTLLENGLTVVLKEMHHAPVTSFWVWYRVGSRNEIPGITGASHWVEHMMFKGSPQFPAGSIDSMISREGGRFNAFTSIDFTGYFETLPSDRIDLALKIESDRMVNAIMTEETVNAERTVIISERHMYENQPMFLLREELTSAAFRVHPYHHEIIGDEFDLKSMDKEDLVNHYQRFYAPNNAIIVVAGDFETGPMLERVTELFGEIPQADTLEVRIRPEPLQRGERRVTVRGPGDTAYLTYAFRSPPASHPDFYPLVLLNAAYAGGGSLGLFSGGMTNKSSRLYKALVSSGLAAAVSANIAPTIDPYLYSITAVARPDRTLKEIEDALEAELDRLEEEPVSAKELGKALKRAKAQFVLAGESASGQGQMLGMAEVVAGDYQWYENTLDAFGQITLDDIERVRQTYLQADNRTVGLYEPTGNGNALPGDQAT
jgi:zinc protease